METEYVFMLESVTFKVHNFGHNFCWILDSFEWNKHRCICTLLEFIVINVVSLLYKVKVIGMEITLVFIQSQQWKRNVRNALGIQLTDWY